MAGAVIEDDLHFEWGLYRTIASGRIFRAALIEKSQYEIDTAIRMIRQEIQERSLPGTRGKVMYIEQMAQAEDGLHFTSPRPPLIVDVSRSIFGNKAQP